MFSNLISNRLHLFQILIYCSNTHVLLCTLFLVITEMSFSFHVINLFSSLQPRILLLHSGRAEVEVAVVAVVRVLLVVAVAVAVQVLMMKVKALLQLLPLQPRRWAGWTSFPSRADPDLAPNRGITQRQRLSGPNIRTVRRISMHLMPSTRLLVRLR